MPRSKHTNRCRYHQDEAGKVHNDVQNTIRDHGVGNRPRSLVCIELNYHSKQKTHVACLDHLSCSSAAGSVIWAKMT